MSAWTSQMIGQGALFNITLDALAFPGPTAVTCERPPGDYTSPVSLQYVLPSGAQFNAYGVHGTCTVTLLENTEQRLVGTFRGSLLADTLATTVQAEGLFAVTF